VKPAAAALVVAVSIAGCGSSTLSGKQLRSDATQVCSVTRTHLNRIAVPSSPTAGEPFLNRGIEALRPEIAALRKLSPPKQLGSTYGRALDALTSELAEMEVADVSLRHGADPVDTFRTLAGRIDALKAEANTAWTSLRIPACTER
jgi:hypothetical protein